MNLDYSTKKIELHFLKIKIRRTSMSPLHPQTIFINESGLYQILANSTKPLAKVFMDKYFKQHIIVI